MKLMPRLKKELYTFPYRIFGYTRKTASRWYYRVKRDNILYSNKYSDKELKKVHRKGYLAKNIKRYNLFENENCNLITDLEYLSLRPFNNDFYKWIDDQNTMQRVLYQFKENFYDIHFSIIARGKRMIFNYDHNKEKVDYNNVLNYIKTCGKRLELRPVFWNSKASRYIFEYKLGRFYANDKIVTEKDIIKIIRKNTALYILIDKADFSCKHIKDWGRYGYLKVYIANDYNKNDGNRVLFACMCTLDSSDENNGSQYKININEGSFYYKDRVITIPGWKKIIQKINDIATALNPVTFFSMSFAVAEDNIKIVNANGVPYLPRIDFSGDLNKYLKEKLKLKKAHRETSKEKYNKIKNSVYAQYVKMHARTGMRPYMYKLWKQGLKSDLLNFRETSLKEKLWCWKRGFFSYRLEQYNLTEDNYKDFLSDYDYHWLNRINNPYQCWINDKTTFRYVLNDYKNEIPEYYFLVFNRNGKTEVQLMPDANNKVSPDIKGILKTIRQKKKVVFKPSSGTHGDGFYCIEFKDNHYLVNGEFTKKEDLLEILLGQKSFYVLTDYINMHSVLKKIYPKSVNSIRVMAINENGNDPRILQTYIRIGSSKTGYTDNVGYGGISAMIDEDGYIYEPQKIINHKFYLCDEHPDTKTIISGIKVPNWGKMKKGIIEVCKSMPELEYLGFDIAITPGGFQIIEINIHQDLHKVAEHTDEVRRFYKNKIEFKKMLYKISD